MKSHPFVVWPLALALGCVALLAGLQWALDQDGGLARTVGAIPGASDGVASIDWTGSLLVSSTGLYQFAARGDGRVRLAIDARAVLDCGAPDTDSAEPRPCQPQTVWLDAGFHWVDVGCERRGQSAGIPVSWAPAGKPLGSLQSARLVAGRPRHPSLRLAAERARVALRAAALTGAAAGAWFLVGALFGAASRRLTGSMPRKSAARLGRGAAIGLVCVAVGYAVVLRSEALSTTYGLVEWPGWLRTVQIKTAGLAAALRPAGISYDHAPLYPHKDSPPTRYYSDPYTYLQFARQMTSFYAAHFREPVFPFATKVWLKLLGDQDVAVSFASATFSVLSVLAVYLLGTAAFSRWVGLGAALAMAIEGRLITEGVSGWRDEAFMFAVVMFAWALVRWWNAPSERRALIAGAIGGFACLVRITSVSFVVPGLACLLALPTRPLKARLRQAGLAAFAALVVAGPYVVNCWLTFGDPLYAINVHANVYRGAEGQPLDPDVTATGYIGDKFRRRPLQTLDTAVWGLTANPFLNKWTGFDAWSPVLGTALSASAVAGLVLLVGSGPGRLLLVVLVTSLVPYAVTWRIGTDWRFTEHAYPFLLVASCGAIWQMAGWLTPSSLARLKEWRSVPARAAGFWAAVLVALAAGAWAVVSLLPPLVIAESLASGEDVTITVSGRDASLVGDGWSAPLSDATVTSRVAVAPKADFLVPLPEVRDYGVTLRLDPFPRPLADSRQVPLPVDVLFNGTPVSRVEVRWTPGRVGAYDLRLPAALVLKGINRLTFVTPAAGPSQPEVWTARPGVSGGSMLALWYVRVRSGPS